MLSASVLGAYEIVGLIRAAGNGGGVSRARDVRPLSPSQLFRSRQNAHEDMRGLFSRNSSQRIICTLYAVGGYEGTDFLVMECLEGETLATRLSHQKLWHKGDGPSIRMKSSDTCFPVLSPIDTIQQSVPAVVIPRFHVRKKREGDMVARSKPHTIMSLIGVMAFVTPSMAFSADDGIPRNPTFTRDVLPIVQKHCQTCHRPNMSAPVSLLTYEDARPWARSIKQKVQSREMPPWFSDPTIGEYKDDPSLTEMEIAILSKWVDSGAPRGKPADAPPPVEWPASHTWHFGEEPDLVITSPGIDVPAVGPDSFPEPEVPTGLAEDRHIKWIQIIPEQTAVVHHVVVYAMENEPSAAEGRTLTLIANRAKGGSPDLFDEGQAKLLRKGANIRFQVHLHPYGEAVTEHTKVGIKFFPKGYVPKHQIISKTVSSPATLAIPPMEANSRSDSYFTLTQPATLVSFQPHMHYRGKRMTLEVIPPSGQSQLLSDINRFIQTWQLTYRFKNPPILPKGTVLHVTAYHDNSAANRLNPDPSAFVGWGSRTVDEMNIGWVDFYYLTEDEYKAAQKGVEQAAGRR